MGYTAAGGHYVHQTRLLTRASQRLWLGRGLDGQGVEKLPEGTRVAPQLWAASLTSHPPYMVGEENPRNLRKEQETSELKRAQQARPWPGRCCLGPVLARSLQF